MKCLQKQAFQFIWGLYPSTTKVKLNVDFFSFYIIYFKDIFLFN